MITSTSKISKKNLDFYISLFSRNLLSLKNSVADPDPGSDAFFGPWIGWMSFLFQFFEIYDHVGSGIRDGEKSGSGINNWDPQNLQ
jgi:hypothetical protein